MKNKLIHTNNTNEKYPLLDKVNSNPKYIPSDYELSELFEALEKDGWFNKETELTGTVQTLCAE